MNSSQVIANVACDYTIQTSCFIFPVKTFIRGEIQVTKDIKPYFHQTCGLAFGFDAALGFAGAFGLAVATVLICGFGLAGAAGPFFALGFA
jgi:hypothetical protein